MKITRAKLRRILRETIAEEEEYPTRWDLVSEMAEYIQDLYDRDPGLEYNRPDVYQELYDVFHANPWEIDAAFDMV